MAEGQERGRRRPRAERSGRAGHPPLAPLAPIRNPFPALEPLTPEGMHRVIDAAFRLLEEAGLEFRSAPALRILAEHGAAVDADTRIVRMGRELVAHFLAQAPGRFTVHARNPERHVEMGGNTINIGPVGSPPNVSDLERGRRPGTYADTCNLIKLNHALGVLHLAGGTLVEQLDLPPESRHLDNSYALLRYTDRPFMVRGIGRARVEDALEMAAIARGRSREALLAEPSVLTVINVNSPRRVDEELLEGLMAMAENGQVVCVTPFTLAGAMSPVTIGGALVQQTAEALGVLALVQMVRQGCPMIFGGFTSNVDMKSGAPAFGTPEYVQATLAGGQIARHFRLPYRSSNVNASNAVDAQAVYESAMSLMACVMSHTNMVHHGTGWLEGGLVASFEKTVVDAELIREWAEILKPIALDEDSLAVEAIKGVPPGGHFFGAEHTMARFEHAFYRPLLSDWRNFESWREAGAKSATERALALWKVLLAEYVAPPMDQSVEEALQAYMARRKEAIGREAGQPAA